MLQRDRFLKAVNLEEPDLVPVTDLCLDPPIVEAVTGERLEGVSFLTFSGDNPWETAIRNRTAMSEACLKLGFDAVAAFSDYSICSKDYKPEQLPGGNFVDDWGRVMQSRDDTKTTWWLDGILKTVEDVEDYSPPDPDEGETSELLGRMLEPFEDQDVALMGQGHEGWHMAFQIRGGIDKLVIDMYRRPKVTERFLSKVSDACFKMIKLMIDEGIDVLFITDDYADNKLPFVNLEMFKKFICPNIRRISRLTRRKGVTLLKHSDGNVGPIMEDMIEAGIEGIHPIEPGIMDLEKAKLEYGDRICLLGNVDCKYALPMGTEEEVRGEVRRCLDSAASGGGYVLATSNSIHANCSVENVLTMLDEARKRGRYS
jgi:uroporphyrinogen-III decarboxylase